MKQIISALNATRFSVDDFSLRDEGYGELLRIQFTYDENFTFILKEEDVSESISTAKTFGTSTKSYSQTVTKLFAYESPGEYKFEDKIQLSSFSDVPKRIASWCQNIHRELQHNSNDSESEKAKQAFKESITIDIDNPESSFSKEEIESLSHKLDSLYEQIDKLKDKFEISESELERLKKELNAMKENAKTYKKGLWAKITENKVGQLIFEFFKSKEGRGLIVESIKKLGNQI